MSGERPSAGPWADPATIRLSRVRPSSSSVTMYGRLRLSGLMIRMTCGMVLRCGDGFFTLKLPEEGRIALKLHQRNFDCDFRLRRVQILGAEHRAMPPSLRRAGYLESSTSTSPISTSYPCWPPGLFGRRRCRGGGSCRGLSGGGDRQRRPCPERY